MDPLLQSAVQRQALHAMARGAIRTNIATLVYAELVGGFPDFTDGESILDSIRKERLAHVAVHLADDLLAALEARPQGVSNVVSPRESAAE